MVSLIISILVTLTTVTSDGSVSTTNTKDNKKPGTSTSLPGGVGTNGGTSTWENGTHRSSTTTN